MIGRLTGNFSAGILDVNGVGYRVQTLTEPEEGATVTLRIVTLWNDSGPVLYGFLRQADEDMFSALVRVSGVGPAQAMSLLRNLGAEAVAAAVRDRRANLLSGVKGVGRRGAERILLSCKVPEHLGVDSRVSQVADALQSLGWEAQSAREAAEEACSAHAEDSDAIAAALRARRNSS